MPKQQLEWRCPNAGCDRVITMEMDAEPKRNGVAIRGDRLEAEKREVERALEKQAARHLEFCRPRSNILKGAQWTIPQGQRVKGPDED